MRKIFLLLAVSVFLTSCGGGGSSSSGSAAPTLGITQQQLEQHFASSPRRFFQSAGEEYKDDQGQRFVRYLNKQTGLMVNARFHPNGNIAGVAATAPFGDPLVQLVNTVIMATNPGMTAEKASETEQSLRQPHVANTRAGKKMLELSSVELGGKLYFYAFLNQPMIKPAVTFMVCNTAEKGCSLQEFEQMMEKAAQPVAQALQALENARKMMRR